MPIGPGKYDALCTYVRTTARAGGALVIVLDGEHGHGFSCQAPPALATLLPELLRHVADEIEDSLRQGKPL